MSDTGKTVVSESKLLCVELVFSLTLIWCSNPCEFVSFNDAAAMYQLDSHLRLQPSLWKKGESTTLVAYPIDLLWYVRCSCYHNFKLRPNSLPFSCKTVNVIMLIVGQNMGERYSVLEFRALPQRHQL